MHRLVVYPDSEGSVSKPKMHKWTVEIAVDASWVADGFDMENRVQWLEENLIGYAYGGEVKVRVIKAPSEESIAKEQGYKA